MKKTLLVFALISAFIACAPFVDSPFSDQLLRPERALNQEGINRINDPEADGVIRIAVFADSHENYKELDQMVYQINQTRDVDFVVGLGDYVNNGYNLEYDQFLDAISYLRRPKLFAAGNHDLIGGGTALFKKAFGEPNFYFETSSHRFVFFNSCNLEDPEDFNLPWLRDTVNASSKPVIIFMHVHPKDEDRFSGDVAAQFDAVINDGKVQLIMNGHEHIFDIQNRNGTWILQDGRVQGYGWLLVEITGNQLCYTRQDTKEHACVTLK